MLALKHSARDTFFGGKVKGYSALHIQESLRNFVRVELRITEASLCTWQIPEVLKIESSKGCTVIAQVPEGQSHHVSVSADGAPRSTNIRVNAIVVAALGDSYASGEGNPDQPATYPSKVPSGNDWFTRGPTPTRKARWWDEQCHRSLVSWPVLAALRLALQSPHHVIMLLDFACSGATIENGIFNRQKKTVGLVARSQIDALRDALCEPQTGDADQIELTGSTAKVRSCKSPLRKPDALLLAIGGNDVNFAGVAQGLLVPDTATAIVKQPGLEFIKAVSGSIPLGEFVQNIASVSLGYGKAIRRIADSALVSPEDTILIGYANPVVPPGQNCESARARIRDSNLAFGPLVKHLAPWPVRWTIRGWVASVSRDEAKTYAEVAYPALVRMQESASKEAGVTLIPLTGAEPAFFDRRLMCTDEADSSAQDDLEPYFFCQQNECGGRGNRNLGDWKFESPGRRMVNTINDSLLAQRRWAGTPTNVELESAFSGAMHPTYEAHAIGADSVFRSLCAAAGRRVSASAGPMPTFDVCK